MATHAFLSNPWALRRRCVTTSPRQTPRELPGSWGPPGRLFPDGATPVPLSLIKPQTVFFVLVFQQFLFPRRRKQFKKGQQRCVFFATIWSRGKRVIVFIWEFNVIWSWCWSDLLCYLGNILILTLVLRGLFMTRGNSVYTFWFVIIKPSSPSPSPRKMTSSPVIIHQRVAQQTESSTVCL